MKTGERGPILDLLIHNEKILFFVINIGEKIKKTSVIKNGLTASIGKTVTMYFSSVQGLSHYGVSSVSVSV